MINHSNTAETSEYEDKLKEIENLYNPIITKIYQNGPQQGNEKGYEGA